MTNTACNTEEELPAQSNNADIKFFRIFLRQLAHMPALPPTEPPLSMPSVSLVADSTRTLPPVQALWTPPVNTAPLGSLESQTDAKDPLVDSPSPVGDDTSEISVVLETDCFYPLLKVRLTNLFIYNFGVACLNLFGSVKILRIFCTVLKTWMRCRSYLSFELVFCKLKIIKKI